MLEEEEEEDEEEPALVSQHFVESAQMERERAKAFASVKEKADATLQVNYADVERMLTEYARESSDAISRKWAAEAERPAGVPDWSGALVEAGAIVGIATVLQHYYHYGGISNYPGGLSQQNKDAAAVIRQAQRLLRKGVSVEVVKQSSRAAAVWRGVQWVSPKVAARMGSFIFLGITAWALYNKDPVEAMHDAWKKAGIMDPAWKGTGWYTGAGDDFPGLLG